MSDTEAGTDLDADPTGVSADADAVEADADSHDAVEPPFPALPERFKAWWHGMGDRIAADPGQMVEAALSVVAIGLATALVFASLRPSQFLSNTTTTGGDMGSHLWGPRYLLDHLLPHFRLSGWTPDWYDGFPAYQFYMVIPSLLVVILYVGLPWYLAIPALVGCVAIGLAGWWKERLYRYRFVFVGLAAFLAVLVVPLSYNRSFKLVTGIGLLGLPAACWLFAKLSDLPFPVPPLAAVASLLFIFNVQPLYNSTGNIIGGNFQSTMAGEFAFSISLLFAVLYLGVAIRGLRDGRHRALAAVLFAAACLCHLIPAFFVLACTAILFVLHPDRARAKWLATMAPVAGLLTAFWIVPFLLRHDYVNDMGWEKLPVPSSEQASVWYYLWPRGLFWLMVLGVIGAVVSLIRWRRAGLMLSLAWLCVAAAFAWLPQARLWNARLLPFMYLSVSLLAAIAVGELINLAAAAAAGNARRPLRAVSVTAGVVAMFGMFLYVVLPLDGLFVGTIHRTQITDPVTNEGKTRSSFLFFHTTASNPAPGWSNYNYQGLEKKTAQPAGCDAPGSTVACLSGGFKEYRHLIETMAGIGKDPRYGCGRAFWEYDNDRVGGYGTPMSLMMLPYFTDSCIGSQEGLYFESSTTVPYHFYMQSELSAQGSAPQRDLVYPSFDIGAGVRHMQLLGVRYYLASTPTAIGAASTNADLHEIAVSGPWHIYRVRDSQTVSPLAYQPVVAKGMGEGQDAWLPTAGSWFLNPGDLDVPLADGGPSKWRRVKVDPVPTKWRRSVIWARGQLGESGAIDQVPDLPRVRLPNNRVSHIENGIDTISFDVTRPGVPVLVKASYFPNWQVSGADGPYRVSPNLMVVIPHSKHVELHYGRTPVDMLGIALTILGLIGLVWLARTPGIDLPESKPSRVSAWLDEIITIPPLEKQPRRPSAGVDGWGPPPVSIPGQFDDEDDAEGVWAHSTAAGPEVAEPLVEPLVEPSADEPPAEPPDGVAPDGPLPDGTPPDRTV
jgi:hypothetical protein